MADESIIPFKTCSKCGDAKPATINYFRDYLTLARKRLLRNRCRLCEGLKSDGDRRFLGDNGRGRRPKRLTSEEVRERNRFRCAENYSKNRAARIEKMRERRITDPVRTKEEDRRSYRKRKAAGSEYQKRRYARQDKEMAREALKEWRRANPDKVYASWRRTYEKNRAKHSERQKRWSRENPEARAAISDRRRAREAGASGTYTKDDVRALLKLFGRFCFYCSEPLTRFHCDHFIPLAKGGSNDPSNLRLSCPTCNYSKAARMPWEWKPERFSAP